MAQEKKKPVHEIRLGCIRGTAWANRNEDGSIRYNFVIKRLYKAGDEWSESDSYSGSQLPLVCKVADLLVAWEVAQKDSPRSADGLDE